MSWREVTIVSERLDLCRLAIEYQIPIAKLAREFNVSRKTAHKWISRYKEKGEQGVFDISRKPLTSPSAVDNELVEAVLKLHELYPAWGPRKLYNLLCRETGEKVLSISTVARIMQRNGLTCNCRKEILHEVVGRFERSNPNDLWQIDFTSAIKLDNGRKIYPVPILDDHSRYCVGLSAVSDLSSKSALSAFCSAACDNGLPEEILSDHGSAFGIAPEFSSAFSVYMWALNVKHIQGRYAHPQTQGKLERFNETLKRECISLHSYSCIEDWNKCFEDYRYIYNHVRPHQSLNDHTPADIYRVSERIFIEPDKQYKPDGEEWLHRRVQADGRICLMQHRFDVGNGFAGWIVSAKHEGNGVWSIYFRDRAIRQVLLAGIARSRS